MVDSSVGRRTIPVEGYRMRTPSDQAVFPIGRIVALIEPTAEMGTEIEPIPFANDQWKTIEITAEREQDDHLVDWDRRLDVEVSADAVQLWEG